MNKYVAIGILFLAGCTSSNDPQPSPPGENEYLISAELVGGLLEFEVELAANYLGLGDILPQITTNARIYKVTYNTKYNETPVVASGLIGIPVASDRPMAIVSVQHGTIVKNDDAPSENPEDAFLFTALSTTGMITVVPDFLGFGESADITHPYYVEEGEAVPVVDMIHAAIEMVQDSAWIWNNKLLLTGYSEGGYVTMAAHKYIQEHPETNLEVTASASGAGAYDQVHMRDYFFGLTTYDQPFYLAYAIFGAREFQQTTEPMSRYFQQPYADRIPNLFDGSLGSSEINDQLTTSIPDLIQPDFLQHATTDPAYAQFEQNIREFSLTDWVPSTPLRMYHGRDDVTVPIANSQATYAAFQASGSSNVTYIETEGTHTGAFLPMFSDVMPWFIELKD